MTDEEIKHRVVTDSMAIDKLVADDYPVKAKVAWHSETTLECHCVPIFKTDSMQDVINRYFDYFPKECKENLDACSEIRESMNRSDNMSGAGTMMSSFKIPLGLWKMLDSWLPGFFDVVPGKNEFTHKSEVKQFLTYMPKLRTQAPYGSPRIVKT